MAKIDHGGSVTNEKEQRKGLLFREKPLVAAILFPKLSEAVREILYSEILREDAMHREAFGIEEVGH